MRKIYSIMLMAAALLISTNTWATIYLPSEGTLAEAFADAQNGEEIVIQSPVEYNITDAADAIVLDGGKHVILNLNGKQVSINNTTAAKNAGITIKSGILEITGNGAIVNGNTGDVAKYTSDLIRVHGTDATDVDDPKVGTPYAQVIVGAGVTITNNYARNNLTPTTANPTGWNKDVKCNAISIIEEQTNAKIYANGARVDVYGKLNASTYCVKINGSILKPDPTTLSPYVYIHDGAILTSDATKPNAVAAYSSGYGRWRIEGECYGSTGLYVRSGDVEIVDAHIKSTNTYATIEPGKTSGVNAGGSAIVVESNPNYPGDMNVTIAGDETVIESTKGYAIEETVNAEIATKVENITIVSGTVKGGEQGAIIVSTKTVNNENTDVIILGGNISSTDNEMPLQIAGGVDPVTGDPLTEEQVIAQLIPNGYQGETPSPETTGQTTSLVIKTGYYPTLNAYGLATFSAVEATKVPAGLKAYAATAVEDEVLTLASVGDVIPANTGVILYGEDKPNTAFTLIIGGTATYAGDNLLKSNSQWATRGANVYVLVGNELYKYEGTQDALKANKAFLDLGAATGPFGAPKRIQMVIDETQAVENVETVENAQKFMENGQIFIRRGENIYNAQGQIVK